MVTAAAYRPPGAYERKIYDRILPSPINNNDLIALVGEIPKNRPFAEPSVTLTGTEQRPLLKEGIDSSTIEVLNAEGVVRYAPEDYEVIQTSAGGPSGDDPLEDSFAIRRTENSAVETFSFESGVTVYRPQNGRGAHNLRLSTVTPPQEYVELVDWVYDPFTNRLSALPDGSLPRQGEEITLSYDYGIEDGETVQVRYRYADAEYYTPFVASTLSDVLSRFGEAWDEEDRPNPLSLAAEAVFTNASSLVQVQCVPVNPHATGAKDIASLADWQMAIDSVNQKDVGTIIETSGLYDVQSNLVSHIRRSYNDNQSYRTLLGRDGTKEVLEVEREIDEVSRTSLRAYASALNYERALVVSTPRCDGVSIMNSSRSGERRRVGNQYHAAALAGIAASINPEAPLTRQIISGVRATGTTADRFLTADTTFGLCVVDTIGGLQKVRHGVTTAFNDILTREWSIGRAQDLLLNSLKQTMDSNIVGRVMTDDIDFLVASVARDVLERFVVSGVIFNYSTPEVGAEPGDPTGLRVRFSYIPRFPINTITLEFSLSDSEGSRFLSATAG